MRLVALDFETANARRSSACSLGLVVFDSDRIHYQWSTLIDPGQEFAQFNINIHGITPEDVATAPSVSRLARTIWPVLSGATLVSHSNFDVGVVKAISSEIGISPPDARWLDSCAIAQEVWTHLPNHKLKTVCKHLNFSFKHHDALEDARACSHVVRSAMAATGMKGQEFASAFLR